MKAVLTALFLLVLIMCGARSDEAVESTPYVKQREYLSTLSLTNLFDGAKNILSELFGTSSKGVDLLNESAKSAGASTSQALNESEILEILVVAIDALSLGQHGSVINMLTDVLESQPNNVVANKMIGSSLLALNQTDMAEVFLYKAIELSDWKDIISIYNLAECYKLNSDFVTAEKLILKGLSACDEGIESSGSFAFMLGSIYELQFNYSQAGDWFLMSAVQQINNTEVWIQASTLTFPPKYQNLEFAQNVLAEGLRLNPDSLDLMFYLATTLQQMNKLDEAIQLYQVLISVYESNNNNNNNKDTIVEEESIGVKQDVIEPFNQITVTFFNHICGNMATALHTLGRFNEALLMYEKAFQNDVPNITLLSNYAILLCTMNKIDNGMIVLETANEFIIQYQQNTQSMKEDIDNYQQEISKAVKICDKLRNDHTTNDLKSEL